MRVVLVTPELWPYSVESSTAEWAHQLMLTWMQAGHEVAVFSPRYKCVARQRYDLVPEARRLRTRLLPRAKEYSIYRLRDAPTPTYFVDKESMFFRDGLLYQPNGALYTDTAARFAFFLQAALESLRVLDWEPQIVHAVGWPCASLPWVVQGPAWTGFYQKLRTVVTLDRAPVFRRFEQDDLLEIFGSRIQEIVREEGICPEREAMRTADAVQVFSETLRQDLVSGHLGDAIQPYARMRAPFLHALPMSIDTQRWNPSTDRYLSQSYGPDRPNGKVINAQLLAESVQTAPKSVNALAAISSPGAMHLFTEFSPPLKGRFNWIAIVPKSFLSHREALLAAGFKDVIYEQDDRSLSRVLGGAQIFLDLDTYNWASPLLLKALRYGVIPVALNAGAAKEWVVDAGNETGLVNGFLFPFRECVAIEDALRRVIHAQTQPEYWHMLVRHAMRVETGITAQGVSLLSRLADQIVSGPWRGDGVAVRTVPTRS